MANIFERAVSETRVYETSARTLDEVLVAVRTVIGETKRDTYNEGIEYDVRDTGTIVIRYDHEFSLWCAEVIVQKGY